MCAVGTLKKSTSQYCRPDDCSACKQTVPVVPVILKQHKIQVVLHLTVKALTNYSSPVLGGCCANATACGNDSIDSPL